MPDLRAAPPPRAGVAAYAAPVERPRSLLAPRRIELLGRTHDLPEAGGWDDAALPLLWRYNLHYFDDLNAVGAAGRASWHRALLERWVRENPPGIGSGWDPFPTSLRIVNWIKWALRGGALPESVRHSLAIQTRWLERRLEHHLLGNHLLANAKALLHAGLYFSGEEADGWHARGARLFAEQLDEQVLADGAHFELSPMYHAIVLEDVLDTLNVSRAMGRAAPPAAAAHVCAMRTWLAAMVHPDADIAFFNDAAFGIAPARAALEDYARRLALPDTSDAVGTRLLEASGYARLENEDACLLCDCAAVGPDYQPGHAHADTLSFELSVRGRRLLVNSGTSEYGTGAERQRQRGTAAHNTVSVDGRDSSEVWGGFRVARRARCSMRAVGISGAAAVEGEHDGYRRLSGRNRHRRRWVLEARALRIEDRVEGSFASAVARFHLHPDVEVTSRGDVLELRANGLRAGLTFDGAASVDICAGTWHPRFGVVVPNRCIVASFAGPELVTRLQWEPPA